MGKNIAKELHSNNVITGNTISNEGKKIFLIIHGKKPQNTLKNDNQNNSNNNDNNDNNSSNNLVQRDRNANIFIFGEKIEQDFKKIGTIIAETTASNGGINYIYKFYSPNGTMAAEATYAGMDSNECIVITFKDSRRHRITAKRTAESPKNIIEMLVREYYL